MNDGVVAAHLKTESGDGYLFHYYASDLIGALSVIQESMDSELQHVYTWDVSVLGETEFTQEEFEDALRDAIEGEEEE